MNQIATMADRATAELTIKELAPADFARWDSFVTATPDARAWSKVAPKLKCTRAST